MQGLAMFPLACLFAGLLNVIPYENMPVYVQRMIVRYICPAEDARGVHPAGLEAAESRGARESEWRAER